MIKLITLLADGVPAIIAALVSFMTRKLVTATASIAAFIALTAAFIVSINALVTSLASSLSVPSWVTYGLGLFMPSDFSIVLAAIVAARIARAAYDLAMLKINAINSAN